MADGVWRGVYPQVLGRSRQVFLNKILIRVLLLWEKQTTGKGKTKKGRLWWPLTSLPVDRPNTDQLEQRTLVPIWLGQFGQVALDWSCLQKVFLFICLVTLVWNNIRFGGVWQVWFRRFNLFRQVLSVSFLTFRLISVALDRAKFNSSILLSYSLDENIVKIQTCSHSIPYGPQYPWPWSS